MPPHPPRPLLEHAGRVIVSLSDEQAVAVYLYYRSYTEAAAALYISRSALYRRVKRWRKATLSGLPSYVAIPPPPLPPLPPSPSVSNPRAPRRGSGRAA